MKSPQYLSTFASPWQVLVLACLLLVASQAAVAGEGVATTGNLTPVVECVVEKGYGSYTAYFGYESTSGVDLVRPVGSDNKFTPEPKDRNQPETFHPGRHYNVFSVDFSGSLTWKLGYRTASADASTRACGKADLSLTKVVDDATPHVGDDVTFTVTLHNAGPQSALYTEVTDELPAGLTYVSHQAEYGTYDPATGVWAVNALAKNTGVKLTVRAKVTAVAAVTNTAKITKAGRLDGDPTNDQASAKVTPTSAGGGGDVCYVVADDIDAGGTDDEGRVDVLFRVDAHTGAEVEVGLTGTLETESIDFDNATGRLYAVENDRLGVLDQATGAFTALPHAFGSGDGAAGTLAFDDVDGLAFDPSTGYLYGSVRRTLDADLLIRIDPATGKAVPDAFGAGVDYVVVDPVTEHHLQDIDDLAFSGGRLYGTANNDGWGDHLVVVDLLTGDTQDVGPIERTDGVHLEDFEAFTSMPDGTLIGIRGGNHKDVYAIDPSTAKATFLMLLTRSSDYESATCYVRPATSEIDLELDKQVDNDRPTTGGNLTYTITLVNKGPAKATQVDVRDELPSALIYASHVAGQGSYDPSTGKWDVGSLNAGQSVTLKIVAQVKPGSYDPIENTAEVTYARQQDVDSTPDNHVESEDDQDRVVVTPIPHDANLCIQKWVDDPAAEDGDEVTFTIKVCNDPADFEDVVVEDPLPNGLVFIDADPDKGSAVYDPSTRTVTWTIPVLAFAETAVLEVRAKVDTEDGVENCARITASTPPDHPGDNEACAAVTPGQSSGGGDAGVESDGNLATKLAQRLFNRRQDAQAKAALRAAPVPVPFRAGEAVPAVAGKTAGTSLGDLIPTEGPHSTTAYVVTPADLLGITNATSLFAADYVRPEGRRLAALFGATSPAGVLYDHAKATCDRLGGGRLEAVRTLDVDGHPFVLSRLLHPSGAIDYSVSFVAYDTGDGFVVDSRFARGEYYVPADAREVVNLQVWSVAPDYTAELVSSILARLGARGALTFLNDAPNAPAAPDVFVMDGRYAEGRLVLRLVNRSGASGSVTVRGTAARTEREAERGIRTPFEHTVALPAPSAESDVVDVDVAVGAVFDATFEVAHAATGSVDQLYYADGAWSYAAGAASRVDGFETTAHTGDVAGPGRLVVERGAHLTGRVGDWASLFRYLRPGGQPVDLSAYEYVEFTARGTGQVQLVLEKASIRTWDQYAYTFALQPEGRTYRVAFDDLRRSAGTGGFTAGDVTLAAFYVTGGGAGQAFDLDVSGVSFGGASTATATEEAADLPGRIALAQNYPNPFNPSTRIDVELPETMAARLAVYDLLGREVALLADGVLPAGRHTMTFEAGGLPSGTYVYRLVTPLRTLTGKMVLMK